MHQAAKHAQGPHATALHVLLAVDCVLVIAEIFECVHHWLLGLGAFGDCLVDEGGAWWRQEIAVS